MRSFWISLILMTGTILTIFGAMRRGEVIVSEKRLHTLPYEIAGRVGQDDAFDDGVYEVLKADQNLLRRYEDPEGDSLWLYIGYYGTQKGGRTGHLPEYCYPGSGWDIEHIGKIDVKNFNGELVPVNTITVSKGGLKTVAVWWMHSDRHRVLNSGLKMNLNRFFRRLRDNRDDGAFVRISKTIRTERVEEALLDEKIFVERLLKVLPHHWPIEKEI